MGAHSGLHSNVNVNFKMKIDTRTTTSKIRLCHLSKNELEMQ